MNNNIEEKRNKVRKHLHKFKKIVSETDDQEFINFVQDVLDIYMLMECGVSRIPSLPEIHRKKFKVKVLKPIKGCYKDYKVGDIVECSENELNKGYFIQGFKEYAYFRPDYIDIMQEDNTK